MNLSRITLRRQLISFLYEACPDLAAALKACCHVYPGGSSSYHLEDSVWTHILLTLQAALDREDFTAEDIVCTLVHDLAKPLSASIINRKGVTRVSFANHGPLGTQPAVDVMAELSRHMPGLLDSAAQSRIAFATSNHIAFYEVADARDALRFCNNDPLFLRTLSRLLYCDLQGSVLDPGQDSFQKNCALLQDVEKLLAQGLSETSASTPASDGRLRFHLLCGRLTSAKQDYIAGLGCPVLTVPQDCTGQRLEAALASQLERLPQTGPDQEYVVNGSFCTRKERSAAVSALLKALPGKDARPLFACTFVLSPSKKSWLFHGKPVLQGTGLPHTVQCLELPSLLLEESLSSVRILSLPS